MCKKLSARVAIVLLLASLLLAMPRGLALSEGEGAPKEPGDDRATYVEFTKLGRALGLYKEGGIGKWVAPPGHNDHIAYESWQVAYQAGAGNQYAHAAYRCTLQSFQTVWTTPTVLQITSKVKTTDNALQVTNVIVWKVKKEQIDITMRVMNISSQAVSLLSVKRWADIDLEGFAPNGWLRSTQTLFVSNDRCTLAEPLVAMIMSGVSPNPYRAFIDYPMDDRDKILADLGSCSPIAASDAAGTLEWGETYFETVGTSLAPGQARTFKMRYQIVP